MGPLSFGFYTSGQLFAEEYYAQAKVARAGLGTPHLDGNTRLCTATAEWALIESFGCDGDPGSYTDIDALRHALPGGPQRGRDPDRALDADARPVARPRPAAAGRRRSASNPRCSGSGRLAADQIRHERRAAERDPA